MHDNGARYFDVLGVRYRVVNSIVKRVETQGSTVRFIPCDSETTVSVLWALNLPIPAALEIAAERAWARGDRS